MTQDERLLNEGLHLAMEWGEDWLQPIQARLARRYPTLSKARLDEIDAICQGAMRFGHATVRELAEATGAETKIEDFAPLMKGRYPWADAKNLSRLFSQGMYYALK